MRSAIHSLAAFLVFAAAFATGCGPGLTLVPVSGRVTTDGDPLEGASVVFLPSVPNPDGESSYGVSGPDGRYVVQTEGKRGVVPGKYRVLVSKTVMDPASIPDEFKDDPFMAEQLIPPGSRGKRKQANIPPPPEKYEGAFSHEVPQAGGTFDFEVAKAGAKAKAAPQMRRSDR